MFVINDRDLPITVAQKIITGTADYEATEFQKNVLRAITGTEDTSREMFTLDEIEEIAKYLMTYVESHTKGD